MTNRNNRFDSFELLTDDESGVSQTSLKNTIFELQFQFFPENEKALKIKDIDEIIDQSISEIEDKRNDDDDESFKRISLYNLPFVKKIRQSMQCIENLKTIR